VDERGKKGGKRVGGGAVVVRGRGGREGGCGVRVSVVFVGLSLELL